jgi:hypothetical protein
VIARRKFCGAGGRCTIFASERLDRDIQPGMDLQWRGQLALISGLTAGIGFAIAESMAREGCKVIAVATESGLATNGASTHFESGMRSV